MGLVALGFVLFRLSRSLARCMRAPSSLHQSEKSLRWCERDLLPVLPRLAAARLLLLNRTARSLALAQMDASQTAPHSSARKTLCVPVPPAPVPFCTSRSPFPPCHRSFNLVVLAHHAEPGHGLQQQHRPEHLHRASAHAPHRLAERQHALDPDLHQAGDRRTPFFRRLASQRPRDPPRQLVAPRVARRRLARSASLALHPRVADLPSSASRRRRRRVAEPRARHGPRRRAVFSVWRPSGRHGAGPEQIERGARRTARPRRARPVRHLVQRHRDPHEHPGPQHAPLRDPGATPRHVGRVVGRSAAVGRVVLGERGGRRAHAARRQVGRCSQGASYLAVLVSCPCAAQS